MQSPIETNKMVPVENLDLVSRMRLLEVRIHTN